MVQKQEEIKNDKIQNINVFHNKNLIKSRHEKEYLDIDDVNETATHTLGDKMKQKESIIQNNKYSANNL